MQALEAAKSGVQRLEKQGKKWQRPVDYYAEMVKSDEHMARVKSQLMHEQTQIAEAQERCDTLCNAPPSVLTLAKGSSQRTFVIPDLCHVSPHNDGGQISHLPVMSMLLISRASR